MKTVCVFCGSGTGGDGVYARGTRELGKALADSGHRLVYGGGNIGLMGILAGEVLDRGGEVIGVIPRMIHEKVPHRDLTELHVVEDMHSRKALMARLSDGFLALPGGIGTLEELFEIFTWAQLGYHSKPVALLNLHGYFNHLLTFLDHMVEQGFLKDSHRKTLLVETSPAVLLKKMSGYLPTGESKW